jgi:hypothetical protein
MWCAMSDLNCRRIPSGKKTPLRIVRIIAIVSILLPLISCDVFFAAKNGRWNISDPDNELQKLSPSVDGYFGISWSETGDLIAYESADIILIRFDTSDLPEDTAVAYLRLTKSYPNTVDAELEVFRIIQAWDGSSISASVADSPGVFYDDSTAATAACSKDATEVTIPLTGVFTGAREELKNGIIIYAHVEITEPVQFFSSESASPPVLLVGSK